MIFQSTHCRRHCLARFSGLVVAVGLLAEPAQAQNTYIDADDPAVAAFRDALDEVAEARELLRQDRYAEAAPNLLRLAEAGNPWAQNLLGTFYSTPQDGDVFPDDHDIALDWYERAAAQGFVLALHNMATDWRDGFGTTAPDLARAVELFEQAAALSYAPSMGELAMIYGDGGGAFEDPGRGVEMIDRAIALRPDDPWLQTILADTFYFGRGREIDFVRSLELYERAAASGDAYAETSAGIQYLYGEGTDIDPARARAYLTSAADQTYRHAYLYLADTYFYGAFYGLGDDPENAYRYARLALDAGDDWAGYWAGYLLIRGEGTDLDYAAGRAALQRAVAAGHPDARAGLADMAYFGWGGPVDYDEAWALAQANRAEHPDDLYTLFLIADLQLRGRGTAQDIPAALAANLDLFGIWDDDRVEAALAIIYGHPDFAGAWSDPVRAQAHCLRIAARDGFRPGAPDDILTPACDHVAEVLTEAEEAAAAALSGTL